MPAVKALMAARGIALSGTRSSLAIFVRDQDRTTLEFERNDGGDEPPAEVTDAMIGGGKTLDHVGIRVRAPYERHMRWYADTLGFGRLVTSYAANEDPLKNMPPWVTRSEAGCDINFIINCNTPAPPAGEAAEAPLVKEGGVLVPGILYPAFEIAEPAAAALERLRAAGACAALDSELPWQGLTRAHVLALPSGPTVLLRDLNGNFIRLVPRRAEA